MFDMYTQLQKGLCVLYLFGDGFRRQRMMRCPSLRSVSFNSCFNLTDAAAGNLRKADSIESVKFTVNKNLTDAAAAHLAQMRNLREVDG